MRHSIKDVFKEIWDLAHISSRYGFFFLIGIIIGLAVGLCACSHLKSYPQDNFLEEALEEVIENKTGLDIDLSPFSPEVT